MSPARLEATEDRGSPRRSHLYDVVKTETARMSDLSVILFIAAIVQIVAVAVAYWCAAYMIIRAMWR